MECQQQQRCISFRKSHHVGFGHVDTMYILIFSFHPCPNSQLHTLELPQGLVPSTNSSANLEAAGQAGQCCTAPHRATEPTVGCRSGQNWTTLRQVSTAVHRPGQLILKWQQQKSLLRFGPFQLHSRSYMVYMWWIRQIDLLASYYNDHED